LPTPSSYYPSARQTPGLGTLRSNLVERIRVHDRLQPTLVVETHRAVVCVDRLPSAFRSARNVPVMIGLVQR
ncbi:hypothetical protein M407DRAFT_176103, partial [Tulasnella calospora MUT 4182]